jgi:hypothetical protein
MPQASEIVSNLPRTGQSYDDEMNVRQSYDNAPAYRPDVKVIDLEEAAGSRFEMNYAAAAEQRIENQDRFMGRENERRRFVNFMHPHKFFRQLRRAGVDARIEAPNFYVWKPDDKTGKLIQIKRERSHGRLWLHDDVIEDRVGVSARVFDLETQTWSIRPVTWLQYPYGPEWSLVNFDEYDVPMGERWRGWRTALLHLILADVITEAESVKAFGRVGLNDISVYYRKMLAHHRLRKAGLIR